MIARNAYAAFSRGGVDAILVYLHPDIEWRMWEHFSGKPTTFRGHAGVRKVISIFEQNIDEFSVEPLEFIDAGASVVVPVCFRGKAKGTSEEIEFELVQVWTARGAKAVRLDVHESKEDALRAVGAPG